MLHLKWTPFFIGLAASQTFPGFVPQASGPLVIDYTLNSSLPEFVSPEGRLMDLAVVASPPTIGIPTTFNLSESSTGFLLIMVDTDVLLPNATNITTILHYLRGNFSLPPTATSPTPDIVIPTPSPGLLMNFTELVFPTGQPALASYQSPGPLPDQKHRYTFLLFDQPENFVDDCTEPDWKCIPSDFQRFLPPRLNDTLAGVTEKLGFNVSLFMEEAGLDAPIAGWFMEVENGADAPIPTTDGIQLNVPDAGGNATATATASTTAGATSTSGASGTATGAGASLGSVVESRLWFMWCAVGSVGWYAVL